MMKDSLKGSTQPSTSNFNPLMVLRRGWEWRLGLGQEFLAGEEGRYKIKGERLP